MKEWWKKGDVMLGHYASLKRVISRHADKHKPQLARRNSGMHPALSRR